MTNCREKSFAHWSSLSRKISLSNKSVTLVKHYFWLLRPKSSVIGFYFLLIKWMEFERTGGLGWRNDSFLAFLHCNPGSIPVGPRWLVRKFSCRSLLVLAGFSEHFGFLLHLKSKFCSFDFHTLEVSLEFNTYAHWD